MYKCGICEERDSGYEKITEATGKYELLAPRIENQNDHFTKTVLFADNTTAPRYMKYIPYWA